MSIETQKNLVKSDSNMSDDMLKIGVYSIYDCVLQEYDIPISIPVVKLYDYMAMLVNDVQNKYYNHEVDFVLYKVGDFDKTSGEIILHEPSRVTTLDMYIDRNQRKLQTIIKVLNYLPQGYFKMPVEQKQDIQDKIDCAITEYVANYVIPDLDVSQFDTKKINDIYKRYDEFSNALKSREFDFDDCGIGAPRT